MVQSVMYNIVNITSLSTQDNNQVIFIQLIYRMYSQNNISKMRRLSNTIEIRSHHSTIDPDRYAETVKLPALNAIAKSVKYGDLSFTMDKGLNKLRKEPEGTDSLAQNLAQNSLMTIRKKYDNINKERQEQEALIHELEIEKEKFKTENTKYQHEKAEGDKKVKHLQQEMKNVKLRCEEAQMQKKVVCNMMQRLKSDKIVFDQRKYVMQHSLKFIAKQKEIILKERASMKQEEDNTKKIYYKMVEHIEEQQRERQNHLRSIQNMIHQKIAAYDFNFGRQSEMIEIAQNTLSEKDNSEKKWYKVYLCQRFVQRLLRDKMAREMKKFGTVETAFKNIKTQTGVTTTEELVKKFLNKERDYGVLLGTIADDQKQISKLKADNQEMNRQRSKLRTQRNVLTINKRQNTDLTKEEKELNFIDEKSTNCEVYLQKLTVWLGKVQKKLSIFNNQKVNEVQIEHKHIQIVIHFTTYLKNLLKELQIQKIAVQNDKNFDAVNTINNLRIQIDSEKFENEKKPKQITEFDQGQHVNNLRLEMLRNNEKHMKELKRKYEEIKRQRLEAQPKKKDVSPEKAKVPVPPVENN